MWRGFKRVLAERLPNASTKGLLMYGMTRCDPDPPLPDAAASAQARRNVLSKAGTTPSGVRGA